MKLPFLRAVRAAWPDAKVHWITSLGPTAYSGLLREVTRSLIDSIHETPKWMTEDANAPRFDLLLDTRNRWKLARKARSRIPHDVFLAPAFRFLFSDKRPSLFTPRPAHMVDRLLQLVELAAGTVPASTGRLPLPEALIAKARRSLPAGKTYVGFAPGAGNPIKIWPRVNFEKTAAAQAAKGRIPVFLLGPQEAAWQESLAAAVPSALFPLQAKDVWGEEPLSVAQTMAVGSLLAAAVANDSGTGHMLAAVDCPLVSLFGPTSPAKLAPRVSRGLVLCGNARMEGIAWEEVSAAMDAMLDA